jgi:hypothetical protein
VGFVVDKVALVQGFSRVLRFPLPIFIPPISPQSPSPIIWGWYNRPVVASVPKVPPHKLKKKCLKQEKESRVKILIWSMDFSNDQILPSTLWSWVAYSLTETSTTNLHVGKGRPGRKADKFAVVCGPIA